jgi:8-oxo-dGTP diphosphatase
MQVTYCADAIVFAYLPGEHEPHVLLGVRAENSDAYPGCHCIPGGEVEGDELAREAAARELGEETGLKIDPAAFDLADILDSPGRDPRGNVVSAAYVVVLAVPELPAVTGADDLDSAAWHPVANVWNGGLEMAFDHAYAIEVALGHVEAAAAK